MARDDAAVVDVVGSELVDGAAGGSDLFRGEPRCSNREGVESALDDGEAARLPVGVEERIALQRGSAALQRGLWRGRW
jgi:hypothetical protein